ncbi:calcium-binding protein, partial [Anabaenopsis tanganyikae]|uniref:calcium-binding protein n=1 Tax=Anabaenopsis tanganyikae TaxID=2785302 RepID=UPI0024737A62
NGDNTITLGTEAQQAGILTVIGGTGNDIINAATYTTAIYIEGGDGADTLTGGTGADTIDGGIGNDTITGGGGADSLMGGDGDNRFIFTDTVQFAAVTIAGGANTDTIQLTNDAQDLADAAFANKTSVEILTTANGNNNITLAANAQTAGIRTVNGGNGDDTINASTYGSSNHIYIDGGDGNDSITGGDGNDTLIGGNGVDTLTGGAGVNTFAFDGITTTANRNIITDFTTGSGGDILRFDSTTFQVTVSGTADINPSGANNTADTIFYNTAGNIETYNQSNVRLGIATDTGDIFYDVDGNFAAGSVIIGNIGENNSGLLSQNILFV